MSEPITGTMAELVKEYQLSQAHEIDNLHEEVEVLKTIPFEPSSHPLWNVAEETIDVQGGDFSDLNAPLIDMSVDGELRKVDLSVMQGKMFCPEDKAAAYPGGLGQYFSKKMPKALKNMGVKANNAIIYNNLYPYAIECGNKVLVGGSSNTNYSIIIVRWVPGETIGLYDSSNLEKNAKAGAGDPAAGSLFNQMPLHGGNLYENAQGIPGYGMRVKGYFGIQLLNKKTVSGLFNIDGNNLPTVTMVNDALAMARANPSNTFIYCHPTVAGWLGEIGKHAKASYRPDDTGVNTMIEHWNKIRVVTDYNFKQGTEANVA